MKSTATTTTAELTIPADYPWTEQDRNDPFYWQDEYLEKAKEATKNEYAAVVAIDIEGHVVQRECQLYPHTPINCEIVFYSEGIIDNCFIEVDFVKEGLPKWAIDYLTKFCKDNDNLVKWGCKREIAEQIIDWQLDSLESCAIDYHMSSAKYEESYMDLQYKTEELANN